MLKLKNVAPLSGSFMITSITGFLISVLYVFPKPGACTVFGIACRTLGFTLTIFFMLMFVASLISMTYGPDEAMYPIGYKKRK